MGEFLTISDVRERTGLAASALRFYERRGLIRPVGRAGGKRVYGPDAVEQVVLVDLLKLAGFTLGEIAELIDVDGHFTSDWRERLRSKVNELDGRIEDIGRSRAALVHALECPHEALHECPTHRQVITAHAAARQRNEQPTGGVAP